MIEFDDEWIEIAMKNGLSPDEMKGLTKHDIIQLLRNKKAP